MLKTILTHFAILTAFSFSAYAQFERTKDVRTSVPELLTGNDEKGLELSFGLNYVTGNARQIMGNGALKVFRQWEQWIAYLEGRYFLLGINDPLLRVQNQGSATFRVDYKLSTAFRIFIFNTNAFNEFLNLSYRGTLGIGPWWQVEAWEGRIKNGMSLAIAREYENYRNSDASTHTTRLSLRNISTLSVTEHSRLGYDFFYVPNVNNWHDFRLIFSPFIEADFYEKIIALKLGLVFERDNRPPSGVKKNDNALASSLIFRL